MKNEDESGTYVINDAEDEDNIYIYEETDEDDIIYAEDEVKAIEENAEEDEEMDDSALNYAQISEEKDPDSDAVVKDSEYKSVFSLLLMVLSNPVEGWKRVRREKISVETSQLNCFYPLLAIMAISHFAVYFYNTRVSLPEVLMGAVTSFVSYFAGYFCIIILLKLLLPKGYDKVMDAEFGKVFIILNLSSLCLFFTLMELLPMLWPVLIFLPLWTVYVICRGIRFFKFPEEKTIFCTALFCLLIIGLPSLLEWALNEVLPN